MIQTQLDLAGSIKGNQCPLETDLKLQSPSTQQVVLREHGKIDMRIVESISDCITVLDLDGRLVHINASGLRILERTDDSKIENRSFADLFERGSSVAVQDAVAAAHTGESSQFIASSRSPSGKRKWWDVAVSPIMDADESVAQVLAISRDITIRKRNEEFRALEHSMLEQITSGSPLDNILEGLVLLIEQYSVDTLCCVLLLGEDEQTVQRSTAPNFSDEYVRAVHGLPVGPRVGSCGTAMFRRSRVIVEDIYSDPLW